ncbi:hypothetical protein ACFRFH_12135 [Leifsonia sp. NPDC056824]|uniref:hypothetical protein n=1 Tax=Leifsonia sp. NPDC056824 TaxID=3345953 RepID=UPI0036864982
MGISLDASDFYRVKAELDAFDPALTRSLRKNLKLRGLSITEAIKEKLREPTPEGNASGPGRDALIAGTHVTVSFGVRSGGVKIVTSGSGLPAGHAALLKVYNLASFRHPVFESGRQSVTRTFTSKESKSQKKQRVRSGELAAWVTESGNPFFDKVIEKELTRHLLHDMEGALDEAIAAIGGR